MDDLNNEIKNPSDILCDEGKKKSSKTKLVLNIILALSFFCIISYYSFSSPIRERDVTIHVSPNDSLSKISNELVLKKVIRYSTPLKVFVYILNGDKYIKNGDYLFKKNESLLNVSWQLSRGKHGVEPIRVTLKEGITIKDMTEILADKIPSFRKDLFLSDSRSKEGYLFPDTYFFFSMSTTDEILDEMTGNFKKRISSVEKEINNTNKSLSDIITMASILEKEAKGKEDISIISGILWKRIELGMPLQVDAAPITYKERGLPSIPISNPGLSSIEAAIHPQKSNYLFYLHDKNGQVHFAVDFNGHKSNISHYLK